MVTTLRWIMALTAVSLLVAAALHAGILVPGPLDQAAMYESGIAVILLIGVGLTFAAPGSARWVGVVTQVIALAGASIGLYLALRGLGPNTVPDIIYHFALVGVLLVGIVVAWRIDQSASGLNPHG